MSLRPHLLQYISSNLVIFPHLGHVVYFKIMFAVEIAKPTPKPTQTHGAQLKPGEITKSMTAQTTKTTK